MRLTAGWVSTLLQRTLLHLWETFDPAEAGRIYDARRERTVAALRARGFEAIGRTGINIWVPVPDETQAVSTMREAGYAVAPGHLYRIATPPAIRITAATLREEEADAVAESLQNPLRAMVGR